MPASGGGLILRSQSASADPPQLGHGEQATELPISVFVQPGSWKDRFLLLVWSASVQYEFEAAVVAQAGKYSSSIRYRG